MKTATLVLGVLFLLAGTCSVAAGKGISSRGFTMWQLPSQIGSIGMSYVIQTRAGRLAVVDGGFKEDAGYLRGFIAALGDSVDIWIITHPHDDHAGALNEMMKTGLNELKIKTLYMSSFDPEWYKDVEKDCAPFSDDFYSRVKASGIPIVECAPGMSFSLDEAHFRILGVKNPEFTMNPYNNSSIAFKVEDARKSILFLGDLGVEGGEKLLHSPYAKYLKSDYVQMAHHGQNGVDEAFYKAVEPKYCLWPTPLWVWNNDSGKGTGSGPWKTLETRGWIEKLHVKQNYVSCMGLVKID